MKYISHYNSILGKITLLSDGDFLTNLYFNLKIDENNYIEKELPIFTKTKHWLDLYFQGHIPSFTPEYKLNVTKFQKQVLNIVKDIPYGKVITYKDIAKTIAKNNNLEKMSSQAIGQAISKNPIWIIIPCHRVIGSNKSLVGYRGGIENKIKLLSIEKYDIKIQRCKWCNLSNKNYIKYHDEEWCVFNNDEQYLYKMLILESFQAGLSWECILNKKLAFEKAYDNFDINKIINYKEDKINELLQNKNIIRNKLKIKASINNSIIFKKIQLEFGSFYNYLLTFTKGKIYYEINKTTSSLSDNISKDLTKRGMKFVGSIIIYSYLQAIGIIYSHEKNCFLYKKDLFN